MALKEFETYEVWGRVLLQYMLCIEALFFELVSLCAHRQCVCTHAHARPHARMHAHRHNQKLPFGRGDASSLACMPTYTITNYHTGGGARHPWPGHSVGTADTVPCHAPVVKPCCRAAPHMPQDRLPMPQDRRPRSYARTVSPAALQHAPAEQAPNECASLPSPACAAAARAPGRGCPRV